MVKLTIDGIQFEAAEGTMVLDVARAHNIYIPTLCTHESVSPYGACRLCMVEITTKKRTETSGDILSLSGRRRTDGADQLRESIRSS